MSRVDPMLMAVMMAAGIASLAMAVLAWRRRSSAPSIVWLVIVLIGVAEVLIPYSLSYGAIFDPKTKVWLINITYLGWLVVPPTFLVYLARLTGRDGWLTPVVRSVLFAVPLLPRHAVLCRAGWVCDSCFVLCWLKASARSG